MSKRNFSFEKYLEVDTVDLLPTVKIPEPSTSSNAFVVRPSQDFVSDSDRNALETHFPDLFLFGRSGFGVQRKTRI